VSTRSRTQDARFIASHLLPAASLLTRLLVREVGGGLSLTEVTVLRRLAPGPRRITELAELTALSQPSTTLLVKRLEARGLVTRQRQRDDQRVVLASLTDAGNRAQEEIGERIRATLREHLDAMPEERIAALASAAEALDELNASLSERQ
jgi:MarR family 2-MHQ and catechol resistance regulon transcriptional repressor